MDTLTIKTRSHTEFVNIDGPVQDWLQRTGQRGGGLVHVFCPHTTAGLTINENADPDVVADMKMILERVVPWEGGYAHAEGNAAAHVKASMMGFSQTVPVSAGQLCFGTWQSLYFCEFDGPRTRRIWVQFIPAA